VYSIYFGDMVLAEIVVSPKEQNSGIGKDFLNDLKEVVKKHSITRLELDVGSFNESAKRFFISQGFLPLRERMEINLNI
jgi:ribosomal protein S18 acetylase RimI-like enzyme